MKRSVSWIPYQLISEVAPFAKEREPLDIQWLPFRLPCLQQIRSLP